jgi:hypothetical protein
LLLNRSFRRVFEPDNEAVTAPDLYVVIVQQPLGLGDGFAIVTANHLFKSDEMLVVPDDIDPVLCHMPRTDSPALRPTILAVQYGTN